MRLSWSSMNFIIWKILVEPGGISGLFVLSDHVTFESAQRLDKMNSGAAHRKCSGRETIRFVNVRPDYRQAYDIGDGLIRLLGVINMLAAQIAAGSCDTALAERKSLDDLLCAKWIPNTYTPIVTLCILSVNLDISSGLDVKIIKSFLTKNFCCIVYRPALHQAGWIVDSIMLDVEKAITLDSGLFGQFENLFHILTGLANG